MGRGAAAAPRGPSHLCARPPVAPTREVRRMQYLKQLATVFFFFFFCSLLF